MLMKCITPYFLGWYYLQGKRNSQKQHNISIITILIPAAYHPLRTKDFPQNESSLQLLKGELTQKNIKLPPLKF
jgi:hypothetical protein